MRNISFPKASSMAVSIHHSGHGTTLTSRHRYIIIYLQIKSMFSFIVNVLLYKALTGLLYTMCIIKTIIFVCKKWFSVMLRLGTLPNLYIQIDKNTEKMIKYSFWCTVNLAFAIELAIMYSRLQKNLVGKPVVLIHLLTELVLIRPHFFICWITSHRLEMFRSAIGKTNKK